MVFACSLPSIFFGIVLFFCMPESVHYMVSGEDEKNLEKWFKRATKFEKNPDVDVNVKGGS